MLHEASDSAAYAKYITGRGTKMLLDAEGNDIR